MSFSALAIKTSSPSLLGSKRLVIRIKASVPDSETVNLEFTSIPMEEMQLLSNIIQVLGSSGLGIAKAIVE